MRGWSEVETDTVQIQSQGKKCNVVPVQVMKLDVATEVQLHSFCNLGTGWRWGTSFTLRPPDHRHLQCASNRKAGEPQSWWRQSEIRKKTFLVQGIEPWFRGRSARNLVTVRTELRRLLWSAVDAIIKLFHPRGKEKANFYTVRSIDYSLSFH